MDTDIQDRILEKLPTRGAASVSELAELLHRTEGEFHVGLHQLRKLKLVKAGDVRPFGSGGWNRVNGSPVAPSSPA